MQLSIIIVNFNTKNVTTNCIFSIYDKISKQISYEIILVDNNSTDGSVEFLSKTFPKIKVIVNQENLGFAKANNQGLKIAKGRNVLLLNSDTVLKTDLSQVLSFIDNKEEVGVIGCKVLNKDNSLQYSCFKQPNIFTELFFFCFNIIKTFPWDPVVYWKYMKFWNHNSVRFVDCVSGCFMLIKQSLIEQIGGLDEQFFMYYEDSEFCHRVRKMAKKKVVYFPNDIICHLHGKSGDKTRFITLKECFKSAVIYFNKRHGKMLGTFLMFISKFIWLTEMLLFCLFIFNKGVRKKLIMLRELIDIRVGI
ncbi:glycosyltransferase family 2 protein [Candidatus Pacearchaeota archaeon]|nr:glycosyltransferase family 2 protein [Candidatus Pacearchaeota archaeon]